MNTDWGNCEGSHQTETIYPVTGRKDFCNRREMERLFAGLMEFQNLRLKKTMRAMVLILWPILQSLLRILIGMD